MTGKTINLFYSYSHADEALRDELEKHLKMLQRQHVIDTWHDRKICSGTEWDKVINNNLERPTLFYCSSAPIFWPLIIAGISKYNAPCSGMKKN
ncbi:MAG: hypothetical protein PHO08_19425 [Methylococcales bacterium]|nr:hypothetical protein [Methylococcales bacterium]MDD5632919.1 hypothetical protein [Methylococcales bacterium]